MYRILTDLALNDSNKDFIVPTGRQHKLEWGYASLASTAVVGNRQMIIELIAADGTTVLVSASAGAVQAASLTNRYNFAPGSQRGAAFVASQIDTPILPNFLAIEGQRFRIRDSAAIDAAADDLLITIGINDMGVYTRDAADQY
jgi:hypothetical protein